MNKFENAINNLADQIENGHLLSSINGGCDLLNAATDRIKKLEAENEIFRYLLWLRHGHDQIPVLYGDDGEMQCGECLIDFKRNSAQQIDEKFVLLAQNAPEGK